MNKKITLSTIFLVVLSLGFSFGFFYTSSIPTNNSFEMRNLEVSGGEITITTPKNITYLGPMKGYYPGTFGFENQVDGTSGTDINFVDIQLLPRLILFLPLPTK